MVLSGLVAAAAVMAQEQHQQVVIPESLAALAVALVTLAEEALRAALA